MKMPKQRTVNVQKNYVDLESIAEDIDKRKHVKDPFKDKYLDILLSSFDQVCIVLLY